MALPKVNNAEYPTPEESENAVKSGLLYGMRRAGLTINVSDGTEPQIRAKVFTDRVSIAYENNRQALKDISPLDATGAALVELAGVYGVTKRPASQADGPVTIKSTGPVTLPDGFLCTSPSGIQYEVITTVTIDGSADGGAAVSVQAVSAGENTDAKAGTVLTWDSAAIGALTQVCHVGTHSTDASPYEGDIDGGFDEDGDEELRTRFLARLARPGVGGNPAFVSALAESSTAAVEKAYVYSAVRGPSSYDVAVTKAGTDRTLQTANIAIAANAILAEMPGSANANVTSVAEEQVDVIINATLALPVNAGGAGGGWRDATPWPSTDETGLNIYGEITAIVGNTLSVNSTAVDAPAVGDRFGIWNPVDRKMAEFSIKSVSAFPYDIEVDAAGGLEFVTAGMYCSAGAFNLKQYAQDFLDAMNQLGPGEKTTSVDILPQGRRKPAPDEESPSDLTVLQLTAVIGEHGEILNMSYAGRFDTGTTVERTAPSVASTAADPPRILTLKNLSIRRQA